ALAVTGHTTTPPAVTVCAPYPQILPTRHCPDRPRLPRGLILFLFAPAAMEAVRASAAWVASRSSHVKVDMLEIEKAVDKIQGNVPKVEWDFEGIHYFDNGPLTVQYLFVLDALNFCFWPDKDLTYDNLASGLKLALEKDKSALDADRLKNYTGTVPCFYAKKSYNSQ
uniref:Queuosine 5'-phosphate N-glycosylase/hydrolase n=2 Tax=Aegilops tauschii subsp. strangulata TaxID=200361 RepID=A0A453B6S9_AEGTS